MEVEKKITILLVGDLPLASVVFSHLYKDKDFRIVGVLVQNPDKKFSNDPFIETRNLNEIAREFGVPIFTSTQSVIDEFKDQKIDVGISCRASIIYKSDFINLFKGYFINMHGGILPERAGVHLACHAIFEGDALGGGTLHLINEKIDSGDIIDRAYFDILKTDTALNVYQKTNEVLFELIVKNTQNIKTNNLQAVSQLELSRKGETKKYFKSSAIKDRKRIGLNMSLTEIDRVVRGCDFPGHEPAFIEYEGKKIYLTTQKFFEKDT